MRGTHHARGSRTILLPRIESSRRAATPILVVGGDSAEIFRHLASGRPGRVLHWSGRKTRDTGKAIPKDTEAVVVVLDRISHALARKVRTEATRRGLPVFFQRRGRQITSTDADPANLMQWLDMRSLQAPANHTV